MHLKEVEGNPTHLSHFMELVSAYNPSKEKVAELEKDINDAILIAANQKISVIVSQDCNDFFFVVHPFGAIDLCCRMRTYEVYHD